MYRKSWMPCVASRTSTPPTPGAFPLESLALMPRSRLPALIVLALLAGCSSSTSNADKKTKDDVSQIPEDPQKTHRAELAAHSVAKALMIYKVDHGGKSPNKLEALTVKDEQGGPYIEEAGLL